jgi:hypothetical protein
LRKIRNEKSFTGTWWGEEVKKSFGDPVHWKMRWWKSFSDHAVRRWGEREDLFIVLIWIRWQGEKVIKNSGHHLIGKGEMKSFSGHVVRRRGGKKF